MLSNVSKPISQFIDGLLGAVQILTTIRTIPDFYGLNRTGEADTLIVSPEGRNWEIEVLHKV